jgi:hypothetical protein
MGNLQEYGDFTWRVSDCEELVLVNHRKWWGRFLGIHFCNIHLKTPIKTWEVR